MLSHAHHHKKSRGSNTNILPFLHNIHQYMCPVATSEDICPPLGFSHFFLALRTTGICAMLCWEAQLQCIFLLSLVFGDKDFKSVSAFHLLLRCKRGLQVKYGNNMSKKISFQLTAPFSMLSLCSSS